MAEEKMMSDAIKLAQRCAPHDPKRTPRLGVIIVQNNVVISEAHRGSGQPGDDAHAERIACEKATRPEENLPGSTVYTTLEPCTHHSRRTTSESCTDLLIRHKVGKVVIGILDPNQAVCGRGLNQLQAANIDVEMFPLKLARQVRSGNAEFIMAQQTYTPTIRLPQEGTKIKLIKQEHGGYYKEIPVEFECNLPPGLDVFLIIQEGANWWPQRWPVSRVADTDTFKSTVGIGAAGIRTLHIIRANAFGIGVIDYYRRVMEQNERRTQYLREKLQSFNLAKEFWKSIPTNYQALRFNELPNGLDSLANVTFETVMPE